MSCQDRLLVIAKRPASGQTKTRLVPPLTAGQAAALYECFLADTLDVARQVPGVEPGLLYWPAGEEAYFLAMAPDFSLVLQDGPDLGSRLDNALTAALGQGYRRVVIVNSDGPTLPPACLVAAFDALRDGAEVALGPTGDGGYYLIGATRPVPRLLREVAMSTPTVLRETISLAAEERLQVTLLPAWYDIDEAADLERLVRELAGADPEVAPRTRDYLLRHKVGC